MTDLYHEWRSDLELSSAGDVRLVSGVNWGQQHVLRRLLTSRGGYVWNPTYGVGLGGLVGQPIDIRAVEATVRLQLRQEVAVAANPPPEVRATGAVDQSRGTYAISIRYHDVNAAAAHTFTVPVGD